MSHVGSVLLVGLRKVALTQISLQRRNKQTNLKTILEMKKNGEDVIEKCICAWGSGRVSNDKNIIHFKESAELKLDINKMY